MLRYIVVRLAQGALAIFLVSVVTFGLMHLAPGDPVSLFVGEAQVTQEQVDMLRRKWGLDQPVYQQYLRWLGNLLRGDFGESLIVRPGASVADIIKEAAPLTIKLNLLALFFSVALAIPAGIVAGLKRNSLFDYVSVVASTLGVALPNFWVALVSIIIFGSMLGWLPTYGLSSWTGYILPVAVLALDQTAVLTRLMRGATQEVLGQEYVTTARAKGLGQAALLSRHVVRNALLPIVTVIGYRIAFLLSGTIVIETVFALPGIGRVFINSVYRFDYQVVQAVVLLLAIVVVLGNLLTDLVYTYVDPRIRIR
ncbi:ABC transporter permease [Sphaerobacter thermophilus]|jgi:ABC-type dipeptide/oligopeptide/nickel transport systems, permease components|uniref:Binding-protein-dependent transport systems inner membrane component n=1 Tax=Sphaerobacter thermophilus (strain ATCC 49802 / DSM 20745 / KCCM 41009 / NCIMB 13125 / S 6022) TaxID=479434 RepID=D1C490_SPHTD|nr:ABC transporter permease [Sphaerobacter thermophilus]ACZ39057.1 binding-protein-dependent transport systems inner membrane component [Sphaerobacter thermophilus DSM 20745]PZN62747.1 MAG: ABC transporter permease [Sphaerobacter thermophilus]